LVSSFVRYAAFLGSAWSFRFGRGTTIDERKRLDLNLEGYNLMQGAIGVIQTVKAWEAAYPSGTLGDRIAEALFESESVEDAVSPLACEDEPKRRRK
jgi:hypothetical protein